MFQPVVGHVGKSAGYGHDIVFAENGYRIHQGIPVGRQWHFAAFKQLPVYIQSLPETRGRHGTGNAVLIRRLRKRPVVGIRGIFGIHLPDFFNRDEFVHSHNLIRRCVCKKLQHIRLVPHGKVCHNLVFPLFVRGPGFVLNVNIRILRHKFLSDFLINSGS